MLELLIAAGLNGLPFAWSKTEVLFDSAFPEDKKQAVLDIFNATPIEER